MKIPQASSAFSENPGKRDNSRKKISIPDEPPFLLGFREFMESNFHNFLNLKNILKKGAKFHFSIMSDKNEIKN